MRRPFHLVLAFGFCACAGVTGLDGYSLERDARGGEAAGSSGSTPAAPGAAGAESALEITPREIARGAALLPYSQVLSASGGEGPYAFSLARGTLPSGLTLSPEGLLAGTPATGGSTPLTIAASDAKGRRGEIPLTLEIDAPHEIVIDTSDNVVLATLAGGRRDAIGAFVFTIPTGKIVGSTDATRPALATGTFEDGSVVILVNHGAIHGLGGGGGASSNLTQGGPGKEGGAALSLEFPIRIDNTDGTIFGGGGGGGSTSYGWGCGGGGGQGAHPSAGGDMTNDGASGGPDAPGSGGVQGDMRGGKGGAWGEAGEDGSSNSATTGGKGGAGGAALLGNGHTIVWLGGKTDTQIKGTIAP